MSKVTTNDRHYGDIAAALRVKLGVHTLFQPADMAAAVRSIHTPSNDWCVAAAGGKNIGRKGRARVTGLRIPYTLAVSAAKKEE